MTNVAINGMGRIGRAVLKIILKTSGLNLVAVNDLIPIDNIVYLLKYDSVYGRFQWDIEESSAALKIDGINYPVFNEKDPANLPWNKLGVDIVFECTGVFKDKKGLERHLHAGAKHVILSAPAKGDDVEMVVHGVNQVEGSGCTISCASCTTNCIAPVVEILGRHIGVKKAILTTIHAYTATQALVDGPRKKMKRGRAGACNFVPTSTGAAKATTRILPQYAGKFDGVSVRGPVPVGSLADIVLLSEQQTSVEQINTIFIKESESKKYKGILGVSADSIVSSDIIEDPRASIVDLTMTQVVDGDLIKIMSWYDNEWGYSNQMVREALKIVTA
ncbi:MAG: type I glyceraldehyde-3-phosphate dehydrogenase [Thermodesulfobacteriota bacterium]